MASITLLDVAKQNGSDTIVGLVEESLSAAPEVNLFPVRTVEGTGYKTLVRTGLPTTRATESTSISTGPWLRGTDGKRRATIWVAVA